MLYPYNRILLWNKKEWILGIYINMNESQNMYKWSQIEKVHIFLFHLHKILGNEK